MAFKEFWYRFFGKIEDKKRKEIIRLLSGTGIKNSEFDVDNLYNADSCRSGIVFFDEVNPSLQTFVREISRQGLHHILVVSLGDNISSKDVWNLLDCGALDVLLLNRSAGLANEILARLEHWKTIDDKIGSALVEENLIGKSPVWVKTLRQIVNIARFSNASILITGESGTGKELIARLIHTLDKARNKNRLVVLDCTTIVPELSGSEFFGHERGAFTGAVEQREGAFALANNGTLFLDEVGELSLSLQAELLRVVQEGQYKRVGGNSWQKTDFRLICATNRDLLEQEERGDFRSDFYHRLATWTCHLPPLRRRLEDIPLLVKHFLTKIYEEIYDGKEPPVLDKMVIEYLMRRDYPGNVRELYQLIKRIVYCHIGDGPITSGDIPESDRPVNCDSKAKWGDENFAQSIHRAITSGLKLKDITSATEEMAETIAIKVAGGKVSAAAEALGIDKRTLQMHVKEYKDRLKNEVNIGERSR